MKAKELKKILDGLKKKRISVVLYHPDIGTASTMVNDIGRFKIIEHVKAEIELNVMRNKELAYDWIRESDFKDMNDNKVEGRSYIG